MYVRLKKTDAIEKKHEFSMSEHLKRMTIKGEYWLRTFLRTQTRQMHTVLKHSAPGDVYRNVQSLRQILSPN
jgi:hypothetical protein